MDGGSSYDLGLRDPFEVNYEYRRNSLRCSSNQYKNIFIILGALDKNYPIIMYLKRKQAPILQFTLV
jgi:hypothetical protein